MNPFLKAVLVVLLAGSWAVADTPDPPPLSPPDPPPLTIKAVVAGTVTTTRVESSTSYRAPQGHTHTCVNGHTWDHAANPSHNCPQCGTPQYIVDPVPRMVPILASSSTATRTATLYALPSGSGGCIGPNCPLPSRQAILPWRR